MKIILKGLLFYITLFMSVIYVLSLESLLSDIGLFMSCTSLLLLLLIVSYKELTLRDVVRYSLKRQLEKLIK